MKQQEGAIDVNFLCSAGVWTKEEWQLRRSTLVDCFDYLHIRDRSEAYGIFQYSIELRQMQSIEGFELNQSIYILQPPRLYHFSIHERSGLYLIQRGLAEVFDCG